MAHVNNLVWREPACERLDRVSPSALSVLMACPKRLAFQRDPATQHWQVQSTRAALGTVAHRLTELVALGAAPEPQDRRQWLETRWEELIHQAYIGIEKAWPNREVPEPKDWPGYVATRVRLIRRLADLPVAKGAPHGHHHVGDSTSDRPFPWVERRLEDKPKRLFGTPDRVEEIDGRLRVVDLKSGTRQFGISEDQRQQLLIYARLVFNACGKLPDDAVIQDVRGHEETVEVVREEVEAVVDAANVVIHSFNAMVENATIAAYPGAEVCQWCPFRAVCSNYWTTRTEGWPRLDVHGIVAERVGDSVRLDLLAPVAGASTFRVLLTAGVAPQFGDELVALDLERAGPGGGRMRWNSRLRAGADV